MDRWVNDLRTLPCLTRTDFETAEIVRGALAKEVFVEFRPLIYGGDEHEGAGIGLALVHCLINKHEGPVWAEGK